MKRITPVLLAVLLMLTACSAPEASTQATTAPTEAPASTQISTPVPTPEATVGTTTEPSAPGMSLDETIDVLNSFMADLSETTGIKYTRGFDSDKMIYTVKITAEESTSTLIDYLLYGDLSADDYKEVYLSVREYLDVMDELSGTLKAILDQYGHAECGAMVHLETQSTPFASVYISADGEELVSIIDMP